VTVNPAQNSDRKSKKQQWSEASSALIILWQQVGSDCSFKQNHVWIEEQQSASGNSGQESALGLQRVADLSVVLFLSYMIMTW